MPPYVLRHPALIVGTVAALGAGTVAPAVASAATTPAPVHQTQDLGGLIGGLLGGVTGLTNGVAGLVDQLVAGTLPGVLPQNTVSNLVTTLVGAPLTAVTEILELLSPAQLTQIVTAGPVAATTQLLQGVLASVTKLTGSLVAGTAQLPVVGDVFSRLTAILAGGVPTAADALKTLISILDEITTQLGLPNVASLPAVGPLIQKLLALAGDVKDPQVAAAITRTLSAAAKAAGIDPSTLAALGTAGVAAAAAPAAAVRIARARISSVSVPKNRRSVKLRVICPTTAPAEGCVVRPSVKLGGRAAKIARSVTVARGTTRTLSATLPASTAKKIRKAGGKLVVRVATTGATAGAVTRTVAIPAG